MFLMENLIIWLKNRPSNLQEKIDDFKIEDMEENKVDKGIPSIKTQRAKQRKTENGNLNFPLNIQNCEISKQQIVPFSIVCENANFCMGPPQTDCRKTCKRRFESRRDSDQKTKSATKKNQDVEYNEKGNKKLIFCNSSTLNTLSCVLECIIKQFC